MKLKTALTAWSVLCYTGFATILISALLPPVAQIIFIVAGALIMLGGIYIKLTYCRCPHCGEALKTRPKIVKHCSKCGAEVDLGARQ